MREGSHASARGIEPLSDHCGATLGCSGRQSRAAQRPFWQRQPPPQSTVPPRQSAVHITSAQLGALARATHAAAWQQSAGTQSASVAQASVPSTMLPPGSARSTTIGSFAPPAAL
jgi:hypothetical protein